jgi:hypothetical protein
MKSVKAIKDFTLNGVDYFKGDEVEVKDIKDIVKINEKGFIEPLTRKDIVFLERQFKKGEEL